MNLGVYIPAIEKTVLQHLVSDIKSAFDNKLIKDASIFYDDVGPMEIHNVCGMFHSTDIWKFTGELVVFHPDSIKKAEAAGNNFNITYCHGLTTSSVLSLLSSLNGYNCIAMSEESQQDLVRLTGRDAKGLCPGFKGLTALIGELNHE